MVNVGGGRTGEITLQTLVAGYGEMGFVIG